MTSHIHLPTAKHAKRVHLYGFYYMWLSLAHHVPLHPSSMYSKVDVNRNWTAVLPTRLSFLVTLPKLILTQIYLSSYSSYMS